MGRGGLGLRKKPTFALLCLLFCGYYLLFGGGGGNGSSKEDFATAIERKSTRAHALTASSHVY